MKYKLFAAVMKLGDNAEEAVGLLLRKASCLEAWWIQNGGWGEGLVLASLRDHVSIVS